MISSDVTGVDPDKDIAVLKIDPTSIEDPNIVIKPIALGTSANLLVGQTTLAIGNPFGLDHSLSTGSSINQLLCTLHYVHGCKKIVSLHEHN